MVQGEFKFSDLDDNSRRFTRQADFFEQKTSKDAPVQPSPENKTAKKDMQRADTTSPAASEKNAPVVYSVTQLTRLIKFTLNDHLPGKIVLAGEISNFKHHGSGHLYLTLKDENAQITAVMWKSAAGKLKFSPNDGMAVVATGRVDVYELQGKYQFYIDKLEPAGIGALELAFRQLADKLRQEGLFEDRHKKPLPTYPQTIAIVTSATGAAIEDITNTLNRRFGAVRKLLYPVAVQGEGAAGEIAAALKELNRRAGEFGGIDLIILGRGGGSIEDLWAFNEEVVARAIFTSQIPIISGVGHEIDVTIADMVADCRAATPTAAAELAVPDKVELGETLRQIQQRLHHTIKHHYESALNSCEMISRRPFFARPLDMLINPRQWLDERYALLAQSISERLRQTTAHLELYTQILRAIEPHAALGRAAARLGEFKHILLQTAKDNTRGLRIRIDGDYSRLTASTPIHIVRQHKKMLDYTDSRVKTSVGQKLRREVQLLESLRKRLENLDPRAVLHRGYSITRLKKTKRIINDKTEIRLGDEIVTELPHNTTIESKVTSMNQKTDPEK
ncbi:MAG: exodeoxyribonuclease VII large subunit [Sedimentisphaerales bacterium]|nr:exodeoxyribonuclease VII large subunit [Sedimentisphaerales bacterium]